jgi:bifunctional DNA-binding transcriptional regulator/antitoxin component of YhaV-PrlF toxin-antitoxin module
MEYAIAKLSTKGQLVIPLSLRYDLKDGEELLVVRENDSFILKKVSSLAKNIQEDMKFAKNVEKAWSDYDKGQYEKLSVSDFKAKLDKW